MKLILTSEFQHVNDKYVPNLTELSKSCVFLHEKWDFEAANGKDESNQFYASGKYYLALMAYNRCLLFAKSNEMKALLFGNRSAGCFELKKYEECLQNIQLARDHNFPKENLSRLEDREKKCLELMATEEKFDVSSFLKLSYEPNPQIPFLMDGIEIRTDEKNETGIFATRDLKVGDIICMEESFKSGHFVSSPMLNPFFCSVCSKFRVSTLIPCKTCNSVMFCSEECQKYHELNECHNTDFTFDGIPTWMLHPLSIFNKLLTMAGGSIDELEKLWTESQENPKTIFDLDLSDPKDPEYQKNQLRAFFSFKVRKNYKSFKYQGNFLVRPDYKPKRRFIKKLLKWIFEIVITESYYSENDIPIASLSLFGPLIRRSCAPNVRDFRFDRKLGFYVTQPIAAGEEILQTGTRFSINTAERRQELYLEAYGIQCECVACKNPTKYKLLNKLKLVPNQILDRVVKEYEKFELEHLVSLPKVELFKIYRETCEILQSSAAKYPHQNYVKGEEILFNLLMALSEPDLSVKKMISQWKK